MGRNAHWNEIIRKDCVEGPFRGSQTFRPCVCVFLLFPLFFSFIIPFFSFFLLLLCFFNPRTNNEEVNYDRQTRLSALMKRKHFTHRFSSHVRMHFDSSERFNLLSATCGPSSRSLDRLLYDLALILLPIGISLPVIYEIRLMKFIARTDQ